MAFLSATLSSPTASAATAPVVYTGEAAELTTSTATLKGSVNPSGQPTGYYFQYGTTTAYGQQTPPSPASGNAPVHVTTALAGLAPGTTYHYRLLASTATATVPGADRTFTSRRIPLTFALHPLPASLTFASPFVLSGVVSGTGAAGHQLVLQGQPFPYLSGFKDLTAPIDAGPDGSFTFPVSGLAQSTELRVATLDNPPTLSRAVLERVAVRVTLHVRPGRRAGFARLYGTVAPSQLTAVVHLQRLGPGGRASTVASTVLTGRAGAPLVRFARSIRLRTAGLYRAMVIVSGSQVSGHSAPIRVG